MQEDTLQAEHVAAFTLREFLTIVFKDRWRIAIGFMVPMVLATLASFMPTPHYEAVSTVLVRMGREFTYRPEVGEGNVQPITADREQSLHSEVEIFSSRDLIEDAIAQVGLARLYPHIVAGSLTPETPPEAKAIVELQKHLTVQLLKDSNVIQIAFKHPDAHIAAQVVNRLVANYLEKRRSIFSDPKLAFAQIQVNEFRVRLTCMDNNIAEFKRNHNIVSYDDQRLLLLNQRDGLEIKLKDALASLAGFKGKLADTRASLRTVASEVPFYTQSTVDHARAALVDLRIKETDIASKYLDESAVLTDIRASIASMETYLRELEGKRAETVRLGRSPARDALAAEVMHQSAEMRSADAAVTTLKVQVDAINNEIASFNQQELTLENLMRERQLVITTYQNYVKKLEEARLIDDLDRKEKTNVSVVQTARPPVEKRDLQPIILAVGIVLSTAIALSVAFISELLRGTFLSPEKMQRSLGIPVLASIPYKACKRRPDRGLLDRAAQRD